MNDHHSLAVVRALWQDLLRGALKVLATPHPAGYELILGPAEPPTLSPLRARRQACFEAAVRGTPQKAVGADTQLSPPTVAGLLRGALFDMGIDAPFSRVPIAIPLLAHAAETTQIMALCEVGEPRAPQPHWHVTLSPLTPILKGMLSEAEQAVVSAYLTAKSYAKIAAARGASTRTVANQLALSFRKLKASGRFDVIRTLVAHGGLVGNPVTLTLRSSAEPPLSALAPAPADSNWRGAVSRCGPVIVAPRTCFQAAAESLHGSV